MAGSLPPLSLCDRLLILDLGSGTILEVLRYQLSLIVVPNPTLMDNHQKELAEDCEQEGWAIYGKLG